MELRRLIREVGNKWFCTEAADVNKWEASKMHALNHQLLAGTEGIKLVLSGWCIIISRIGDAEDEILEAEVLSTSPIAGQKIRDIEFPESVLIGGLLKNGEFIKPSGGTLIEEGDTIALFTMAEDIPEVERLLQVSIDFF